MIKVLEEGEVQFAPRQGKRIFEERLFPFIKEELENREKVYLREKDLRELFNASEEKMKFLSLYSKLITLLKGTGTGIRVSLGTHNDGSKVLAFYYRNREDVKAEVEKVGDVTKG